MNQYQGSRSFWHEHIDLKAHFNPYSVQGVDTRGHEQART